MTALQPCRSSHHHHLVTSPPAPHTPVAPYQSHLDAGMMKLLTSSWPGSSASTYCFTHHATVMSFQRSATAQANRAVPACCSRGNARRQAYIIRQ